MKELVEKNNKSKDDLELVLDGYELPKDFYQEAKKLPTDSAILEKFRKCVMDL